MKEFGRRRIINFVRTNENLKNKNLSELLVMMKYSLSVEEYNNFVYERSCAGVGNIGYDTYKYLKSVNELSYAGMRLYSDYKKLLHFSTHNQNDKYWKFPKDLKARHDKLVVEVGNLKELEDKERLEKQQKAYLKVVSGFVNLAGFYDGYSIFIPQEVELIQKHAKKLHQCLVACDYIGKVIDGKCLLVFIMKDGESIATAELLPGNRIGQFYADELDRKDCRPNEKVKAAFNKWLEHKKELEKEEKKRSA